MARASRLRIGDAARAVADDRPDRQCHPIHTRGAAAWKDRWLQALQPGDGNAAALRVISLASARRYSTLFYMIASLRRLSLCLLAGVFIATMLAAVRRQEPCQLTMDARLHGEFLWYRFDCLGGCADPGAACQAVFFQLNGQLCMQCGCGSTSADQACVGTVQNYGGPVTLDCYALNCAKKCDTLGLDPCPPGTPVCKCP